MDFDVAIANHGNDIFSLAIDGEASLATAPELRAAVAEVVDAGARGVLVDFSRATFIDSTVLGVLMGASKRLRPRGGRLVIVCGDDNLSEVFRITLLDRIFEIYDSSDTALAALQVATRRAPVG